MMTSVTPELSARAASFTYGEGDTAKTALQGIDLDIAKASFVVLLGPNGCGKTSLLRMFAGVLRPTNGRVLFRGGEITGPDPARVLMFQERTLFPWKSLRANIEFGLRARGDPPESRAAKVARVCDLVGLRGEERRYPYQMSGGMKQRAELARALALEPAVLLLDEPFASLDALSRLYFQEELLRLGAAAGITLVMVSHDVAEAVFVADRVVVMGTQPGRIKSIVDIPGAAVARSEAWRSHPDYQAVSERLWAELRGDIAEESGSANVDPVERRLA